MKTLSDTLKTLVHILNDGEYHSGSELGEILQVSRNAVWKHITQLLKFDIDIESVHGTGYRLTQPIYLLDAKKIKQYIRLPGELRLGKLELLGSIPSTNDYLRAQAATEQLHICLAEHQTAGRGRLGHSWHSPFAANIYFSCRLLINKDVSQLSGLSLVVCLATIAALTKFGVPDITAKWPNDILHQGKKLGGILIEMDVESHGLTNITIGIGINVNMPKSAQQMIDRPLTSLSWLLEQPQDRNHLTGLLISQLATYLETFFTHGFSYFINEWQTYDCLLHKQISLLCRNETIKGQAMGISETGQLLLKDKLNNLFTYSTGEASLIKQ